MVYYSSLMGLFSVLLVFCFSIFLFLGDSLIFSWLSLELATLGLVPSFFINVGGLGLAPLFSYLVVSGVSSGFIVLGLIFPELIFFLLLGFCIKFGLFPFFGWIYSFCTRVNWVTVYLFSVVLKSSFLFLCYFLHGSGYFFVTCFLCSLTLILLSFFFWVYNFSWFHCWCHMMLSSSCLLLCMSLYLSLDALLYFYLGYFLWGSLCVAFLCLYGGWGILGDVSCYFYYVFLFLATPVSLSLLYKILMGFMVFSCTPLIGFSWVVYSVSEQFYLLFYILSYYNPKKCGGFYSLI